MAAVLAVGLWARAYGVVEIVIAFDIRRQRDRLVSTDPEFRDMPTEFASDHATS